MKISIGTECDKYICMYHTCMEWILIFIDLMCEFCAYLDRMYLKRIKQYTCTLLWIKLPVGSHTQQISLKFLIEFDKWRLVYIGFFFNSQLKMRKTLFDNHLHTVSGFWGERIQHRRRVRHFLRTWNFS